MGGLTTPSNMVMMPGPAFMLKTSDFFFSQLLPVMAKESNYRLDWLEASCSLPCRGKVKPMNFALHKSLYWKQEGRMKVSEGSVVISRLHGSRYSLTLCSPSV